MSVEYEDPVRGEVTLHANAESARQCARARDAPRAKNEAIDRAIVAELARTPDESATMEVDEQRR
jgi:hypothetical protein